MLPLAMKLRALQDAAVVPVGDDCYWLVRCRGFAVYDEDGRVGVVRDVRFDESPSGVSALVVRSGLFHRRTAAIPAAEIDEISEHQRRIVLRPHSRTTPAPAGRRQSAQRMRLGGT